MNTQTGIAVALAVLVVGVIFIYPQFSPFQSLGDGTVAGVSTGEAPTTEQSMNNELQITDVALGSGAEVVAGDQVTVNYVGMLADGTVFDASANHGGPATFFIGVGQVIPGWDQGVVGMKEGGKRKLVIPSSLAYGDQGISGVIPGGATLTFEIELVKITKAP
jgi:FKBP-type peptidyl-prolyl cis-trans isomerase